MSLRTRGSTCRATQGRRQQLVNADLSAWRSTSILETTDGNELEDPEQPSGGGQGAGILSFYTDDAPGLKM